jgi:hypothetical protein
MWELKKWVQHKKLSFHYLSNNPAAIDFLEDNKYLIVWDSLSLNEEAYHLLIENQDKINWHNLSLNKGMFYLLSKNMYEINWLSLSKNPAAIDMLLHYNTSLHNYGNLYCFNQNPHPRAIDYLIQNQDKIIWDAVSLNIGARKLFDIFGYSKVDWLVLSGNPCVIDILLKNTDKIYWPYFNMNPHPKAVEYLKEHYELIDWTFISMNPYAEEIIVKNLDKINWKTLSKNPCIFQFNMYKCATVQRTQVYKDELIAIALHPDRIDAYIQKGYLQKGQRLYDIF